MGAWEFVRPLLEAARSTAAGRCATSAASATRARRKGLPRGTPLNQRAIVEQAFEDKTTVPGGGQGVVETGVVQLPVAKERLTGHDMAMTNIVVPELGESVVEARVAKWLKKEGDRVDRRRSAGRARDRERSISRSAPTAPASSRRSSTRKATDVKVGEVLAVLEAATARPPRRAAASGIRGRATAPVGTRRHLRHLKSHLRSKPRRRRGTSRANKASSSNPSQPAVRSGRVMKDDVLRANAPARTFAPAPAHPHGTARTPRTQSHPVAPQSHRRDPRRARPHVEAPRDDRAPAGRGAAQRRHAHHLQRGGHERRSWRCASGARRRFTKQYGVGLGIASFFVKAAIGALKAFPQLNAEIQGDEIVSSTTTTSASRSAPKAGSSSR